MKKVVLVFVLVFVSIFIIPGVSFASWNVVGFGRDIQIGYSFSRINVAACFYRGDNLVAPGVKATRYFSLIPPIGREKSAFKKADKLLFFISGEGRYISFSNQKIKGDGIYGAIELGGEYWLSPNHSIAVGFGPTATRLESGNFSEIAIDTGASVGFKIFF